MTEMVRQRMLAAQSSGGGSAPVVMKKAKPNYLGYVLAVWVLVMSGASMWLISQEGRAEELPAVDAPEGYDEEIPSVELEAPKPQATPVSDMERRLGAVEGGIKTLNHRVWLLVIANNENALAAREVDKHFHPGHDAGFITFDKDWKMNRTPTHLTLTPEQQDGLRK